MNTVLSNTGYKIKKKDLTTKEIKDIKDELNVQPYTFNKAQGNQSRFSIFLESPKKLYLPRFYGLEKFGPPNENNINEGANVTMDFKGDLREEQKPIEELYIKSAKEQGGGIISLRCGGGKTVLALHIASVLQKKTIVLMDLLHLDV